MDKEKVVFFALSIVAAWLLIVIPHSPLIHKGARALYNGELAPPDPTTCFSDKCSDSCYDGAMKYGYPQSTPGDDQEIRGYVIPKGSRTFYKSVYINLEPNTAYAFFVLVAFVIMSAKAFEHFFMLIWKKQMRWFIAVALIADVFPMYFSFSVAFIYINEFRTEMFKSQMFFTFTELFSFIVLILHASTNSIVQYHLVLYCACQSLCHTVELLLDEGLFARMAVRNMFLALGDLTQLYASCKLLAIHEQFININHENLEDGGINILPGNASILSLRRKTIQKIIGGAVLMFIMFQIFFADLASFSLF